MKSMITHNDIMTAALISDMYMILKEMEAAPGCWCDPRDCYDELGLRIGKAGTPLCDDPLCVRARAVITKVEGT